MVGGAVLLGAVAAVAVMRRDALGTASEMPAPSLPIEDTAEEVAPEEVAPPAPTHRRILMDTPSGDTLDVAPNLAERDPARRVVPPEDPRKTAKPKRPAQPDGRPSRFRFGTMTVSGRLSPALVREVLEPRRPAFQACAPANLTAPGSVSARFVIGRDGAVSNVSNGGTDDLGSATVKCVLQAIYGLTFPKPEGGIVTVATRMTFDPH